MNGADFVATQRITDKAGAVLAAPGETCARVPEGSLPWLLEGGYIQPAAVPRDFGEGTPATLHGAEGVVSRDEAEKLAEKARAPRTRRGEGRE